MRNVYFSLWTAKNESKRLKQCVFFLRVAIECASSRIDRTQIDVSQSFVDASTCLIVNYYWNFNGDFECHFIIDSITVRIIDKFFFFSLLMVHRLNSRFIDKNCQPNLNSIPVKSKTHFFRNIHVVVRPSELRVRTDGHFFVRCHLWSE